MKGIVIENSLKDLSILKDIEIVRSWDDEDWKLHEVNVSKEQAKEFSNYINEGPWYIHFWESSKDDILVVYKDKAFDIKYSNKETWKEAIEYGKSIGILEEQLDFPIDEGSNIIPDIQL